MECSLSCSYFKTFSTFLQWVVCFQSGRESLIHYLDDFLFVGLPDSNIRAELLQTFRSIAQNFGLPLAEEKTCLPTSSLEFLGIYIDTHRMEFRLPEAKLAKLKFLLARFLQKKKVILKDMQALLFSHHLYLSISGLKSPFAHIRLFNPLKEDLLVWAKFLDTYNKRSFFQSEFVSAPDFHLFTDAASSKGFAAIWRMHWCCAALSDS